MDSVGATERSTMRWEVEYRPLQELTVYPQDMGIVAVDASSFCLMTAVTGKTNVGMCGNKQHDEVSQ